MSGTITGGKLAAATNKSKYGGDFYARIGAIGGSRKVKKGFALSRELAIRAGRIGGKRSRRKSMARQAARVAS